MKYEFKKETVTSINRPMLEKKIKDCVGKKIAIKKFDFPVKQHAAKKYCVSSLGANGSG